LIDDITGGLHFLPPTRREVIESKLIQDTDRQVIEHGVD
jgi:hypothetical protein